MDPNLSATLDICFERKFSFRNETDWNLPSIELIHQDDVWYLESFQQMKKDLNDAKSLLNDKGIHWQEHTSFINKANLVIDSLKSLIQTELLTQAWCKFFEVLSNYNVVPENALRFNSLHLCEAPGAFICALNYYLNANRPVITWTWYGNTLNPYYEDQSVKNAVVDDRLLLPTLRHWYFGQNNTGDITDPSYLKDLDSFLKTSGQFDLVTADGSINCIENPSEQETLVAELQFSEMLVALSCLAPGATFVIKKFTFFECITICKMYFLNCVFKEVHVFKPFTSKSGNSEVYVICQGYIGAENLDQYLKILSLTYVSKQNKALFPLSSIPQSFITQLYQCSKMFMEVQKESILENISLYETELSEYKDKIEEIQRLCAEKYLKKCNIHSDVSPSHPLHSCRKRILTSFYHRSKMNSKSLYFQAVGETFENLTKSKLMTWNDIVFDIEKRLDACFPVVKKRSREDLEWFVVTQDFKNRMKTKNYNSWILTGKKIQRIRNSKFCNPLLLHLWTRISYDTQIKIENHKSKTHCYWDTDALLYLLTEMEYSCIVSLSILKVKESECDPLFNELKLSFDKNFEFSISNNENIEANLPTGNRLIYVNTTCWVDTLNPELEIRHLITNALSFVIKLLHEGDCLLLCIQSPFTRFTVGILFMLFSLFEKIKCVLPNDAAPATCGQLWVLNNFKKPDFTGRITEYLENMQQLNVPDDYDVLETVPIFALCGGYFYQYLLKANNNHLLNRLRSITSCESSLL